ncbi:hypothetical protein MTR01_25150 [Burkholderia thailandensis]|uniref:hypothetical protein n=1 Tax=Burkholderia thailandensis TaxID=57975 RepID=UPI00107E7167|nr:hypothetical protein [Burkholderia thailandensis]MCZ2897312.1 hypothetical protein [Burkholderia thailandensis]TGB34840.1 hypothetical protein C6946_04455 [Burkholderia thailandensis]
MSESLITFDVALRAYGDPDVNLVRDMDRACFFAVWAMLVVEFEQALEDERAKVGREGVSKV